MNTKNKKFLEFIKELEGEKILDYIKELRANVERSDSSSRSNKVSETMGAVETLYFSDDSGKKITSRIAKRVPYNLRLWARWGYSRRCDEEVCPVIFSRYNRETDGVEFIVGRNLDNEKIGFNIKRFPPEVSPVGTEDSGTLGTSKADRSWSRQSILSNLEPIGMEHSAVLIPGDMTEVGAYLVMAVESQLLNTSNPVE